MPTFRYDAIDTGGSSRRGLATASSADALGADLRKRGLLVLAINAVDEHGRGGLRLLRINPLAWVPPGRLDIEIGLQQLAAMVRSGLPLLAALETTAEQSRRPRAAALWRDIAGRITAGSTLAGALDAYSDRFTSHVVQLVHVGESTGELDVMLGRAATHLEQSRNLRLMVVNALSYPAIVVLLALGVSGFLVLNVIPRIERFLTAGGRGLPPVTRLLLDLSHGLRAVLPHMVVGMVAAALALWALLRWPASRRILHRFWLGVPMTGRVMRLAETALFARGMSILLESGVTLLDSLRIAERLVSNDAVSERIAAARQSVTQGESLAAGLGGGEFLPMLPRMVAVGETTGALGAILGDVALFHENQLVAAIRRMGLVIEPVLILVVGGIVGFVYVAFFVALFSIATSVH